MITPLHIVDGYFCTVIAELSSYERDHMVHKALKNYYTGLNRKRLLTSDLDVKGDPLKHDGREIL